MAHPKDLAEAYTSAKTAHETAEKSKDDAAAALLASLPDGELVSTVPVDPAAAPLLRRVGAELHEVRPTYVGDLPEAK